ncbi:hypothetical protein CTAYLR_005695 [Chrysophaeum taylorii]|uniref:UDP-glucose:glycoprotein glucosyltransferase n=1 Tax=Chrysophaeum taylorii TaxID=2483200 RepID=A0AAD7UAT8_9STRA|nr:hypothetical protein CTAYLR_005695 [Chrysophaeum taylorii]
MLLVLVWAGARCWARYEVKMYAPWPRSPESPLFEAAEFVAEVAPEKYWTFVERLNDTMDEAEALGMAIEAAPLDAAGKALLGVSLSTREFSARVEAHRSLAGAAPKESVAFVARNGVVARTPDAFRETLESSVEEECREGTRLGTEVWRGEGAEVVELVVSSFNAEFKRWLRILCDDDRVRFCLRWKPEGEARTLLAGFGASLDIKNMEYKNFDDVKNSEDFFDDRDIEGLVFSKLAERKPELKKKLSELRDALDTSELKAWRIRDLSLQASVAVLAAAAKDDPFEKLQDVSQDFPIRATWVSTTRVDEETRIKAQRQVRAMMRAGTRPGIYVGGVYFSAADTSIHALMKAVREEASQRARIGDRVEASDALSLIKKPAAARIDLLSGSKGAVTYLNNLEKDDMYRRWPRSVQQLLYPSWQLHAISKNLYTALVVLDGPPHEAIRFVQMMLDQGYPVRFGLVVSGKLAPLFALARAARGPKTALDFLIRVLDDDDEEDPLRAYVGAVNSKTRDEPKNASFVLGKEARAEAERLLTTSSSIVSEYETAVGEFLKSKNLPSNCFALNGKIKKLEDFQQQMVPLLGEEQQYLSDLVSRGIVTDRTKSIYGKALYGDATTIPKRYSPNTDLLLDDPEETLERPDDAENVLIFEGEGPVRIVISGEKNAMKQIGRDLVSQKDPRVRVCFLPGDDDYIIINGRKIKANLSRDDLEFILPYEMEIAEKIKGDVEVRIVAAERSRRKGSREKINLDGDFTIKQQTQDNNTNTVPVIAVVDPLTREAQRISSILLFLRSSLSAAPVVSISLVLTPSLDLSEMPLQKYYRYVLDDNSAVFTTPKSQVLTLQIDTPEAWDVQTAKASQDLDNLRGGSDDIEYELKSLVVQGQCYDSKERRPPNGLQLVLDPLGRDTLVMQNLGYFQLRGQPGAFEIKLAPNTRSEKLYDMAEVPVVVADLDGGATQLRVKKKPQFKDVDLLDDDDDDDTEEGKSSIFDRWFSSSSSSSSKNEEEDTVHVFSLATGALYERFLKIMMLSVRKRTSGPVKFWLFENYLTPAFKSDAAKIAAATNFSVAYVTYKWPEWLRRQTVKQRVIWGYKILFLDVLFPLNVPKIIYVDADQVVRSDLRELWNLDLKGKPYGYAPFCDSRPETLGFQFWRSGYWKDHLRGKPYHISALYVVDLVAFRRMAVGDQLRAVYDQLSRDPNSLSNLDQDLPNYAQHSIPIFTLPQEWLWCESWCSDSTKPVAKTIDLCNNPQHKENKLSMAKRIINGSLFNESWVQLDDEVNAIVSSAA